MTKLSGEQRQPRIVVVVNWFDELMQLKFRDERGMSGGCYSMTRPACTCADPIGGARAFPRRLSFG